MTWAMTNWLCLLLVLQLVQGDLSSATRHLRKLIGSNCVQIERGQVTPYYDCVGCIVERATACLDDLRLNKTGSNRGSCPIGSSFLNFPGDVCCPAVDPLLNDLQYMGSAYPQALHCIIDAGCESSLIYSDLLRECQKMCPALDPRTSNTICLANFNAASSIHSGHMLLGALLTILCMLATSLLSI